LVFPILGSAQKEAFESHRAMDRAMVRCTRFLIEHFYFASLTRPHARDAADFVYAKLDVKRRLFGVPADFTIFVDVGCDGEHYLAAVISFRL
jgi:hypothetical protein